MRMPTFMGPCAFGLALAAVTHTAAAESLAMLPVAVTGGTSAVDLRLRTENVGSDAAATPKDATATTLRGRLGYTTGKWNDIDLSAEFEGIAVADKDSYDTAPGATLETDNGVKDRPVIPDADHDELNQYWIRYSGLPGTTLQYGRERLILDNARFVGNVGWRQNEQTYDGFLFVNKSLVKTTVTYANFTDINSIFGVAFPLKADLLNVGVALSDALKLTAYGYQLDFDAANTGNRLDTRTIGARATGAVPVADFKLLYTAEFAEQSDYGDSPDASGSYLLGELGVAYKMLTTKLGYEVLGSDDGKAAVQTPLATLHAFNGWADMFLVTPKTGLQDTYVSVGGSYGKFNALAMYHEFSPDESGDDFGTELDLQAGVTLSKQLSGLIKYASYSADAFGADTDKGWLQFEYKF